MTASDEVYAEREQTQVKHYILRHYLERFAHIVGSTWSSITYVDAFAGPWNVRSTDLADSSFSIALEELRKARETWQERGKSFRLRCFFLEREAEPYRQLADFASGVKDAEVEVRNAAFVDSIPDIWKFIRKDPGTFSFLFLDPTGWTGFPLRKISPLLRLQSGEVLVNFMTSFIRRFLNDDQAQASLAELYGRTEFMQLKQRTAGLEGLELEDELVSSYRRVLQKKGGFGYALSAMVLHPEFKRTHFHLVYTTRHQRGVRVFKDTERMAMQEMDRVRARTRARSWEKTGQGSLFQPQDVPDGSSHHRSLQETHLRSLRAWYCDRAKRAILELLRSQARVAYDQAWERALAWPLVWESDLKDWIGGWKQEDKLRLEGLGQRQWVPQLGQSHFLVFQSGPEG